MGQGNLELLYVVSRMGQPIKKILGPSALWVAAYNLAPRGWQYFDAIIEVFAMKSDDMMF